MSWSLRHEGSPRWVSGLTTHAVVEGLHSGQWATTDEVRADVDAEWQSLEHHPAFAEVAAEVEPPVRVEPPDETRLDMNPLIDVSLVLLIFFILTATYETIRKVLDIPGGSEARANQGVKKTTEESLKPFVIRVKARMENNLPVIRVEDQVVSADELAPRLSNFVKASSKRQLLLDAQGVEWGTIVQIMDAARAAGVDKTLLVTPSGPLAAPTS
ncbi:MAG: ExbD/TolR family protein [Gemmataceae bacterium]